MLHTPIRITHQPPLRCVLVHGGEPHIAVPLCQLLASDGAVRVVRSGGGGGEPLAPAPNLRIGSEPVASLLTFEPIDAVVLLGPRARVLSSPAAEAQIGAALDLLPLLADHCRRMPPDARARMRIIQLASDRVFGGLPLGEGSFNGDSRYRPTGLAAAAQAAADHFLAAAAAEQDLPLIRAYHPKLYGPHQPAGELVPRVIAAAVAQAPIRLTGTGATERDWLHVEDLAAALAAIIWHGLAGSGYAIGARCVLNERAIAQRICDLADRFDPPINGQRRRALIGFAPPERPRDLRRALDPFRAETGLGWRPAHDFDATLLELIDAAIGAHRPVALAG